MTNNPTCPLILYEVTSGDPVDIHKHFRTDWAPDYWTSPHSLAFVYLTVGGIFSPGDHAQTEAIELYQSIMRVLGEWPGVDIRVIDEAASFYNPLTQDQKVEHLHEILGCYAFTFQLSNKDVLLAIFNDLVQISNASPINPNINREGVLAGLAVVMGLSRSEDYTPFSGTKPDKLFTFDDWRAPDKSKLHTETSWE